MSGPNYSKLQAIWDMMHKGEHKQAMKLIAQTEQKHPTNPNIQVMKIMCYQKSGNLGVAKELARKMLVEGPPMVDDDVMSSMWGIMRELGLVEEAVEATRKAWTLKKDKQSDSFITECYLCALINARAFSELQKVATTEHKRTKDIKHFTWTIASNILQVAPDDNSSILLLLSSKMLEKTLTPLSSPPRDLIWTLVTLYSRLGQFDNAIAYLNTDSVKIAIPLERLPFIAEVYKKAGKTLEEHDTYKEILQDETERDNWRWWDGYFSTLTKLVEGDGVISSYKVGDKFVEEMLVAEETAAKRRWLRRSPRLASLHLKWLKLKAGGLEGGEVDGFLEEIPTYIKWLSFKQQSHMDVVKFLPEVASLGVEKQQQLLNHLSKPDTPHETLSTYTQAMSWYKLKLAMGMYDSTPDVEIEKVCKEILTLGDLIDEKLAEGMDWSERPHGDEARQVACNILLYKYTETKDLKWVVQILIIMESVKKPKNNTQLQQWHHLLAPIINLSRTDKAKEMDIRFIQHESLSYYLYGATWGLDAPGATKTLALSARNLYKRFEMDHSEITFTAWRNGFASKIFEMAAMHTKIMNSISRRNTYINLASSQWLATCGVTQTEGDLLDTALSRIPDDTTSTFTESWDTTSIAATLQCAPRTPRSTQLLTTLLSTTPASRSTPNHNTPWMLSRYYTLTVLRTLIHLNSVEPQVKPTVKKAKKGKTAPTPTAPTKDYAADVVEFAKKAVAVYEKLDAEAVGYMVGKEMFEGCKSVLVALHAFTEAACTAVDSSLGEEADALGAALSNLGKTLHAITAPWADAKPENFKETNFAVKYTIPYVKAFLEVLLKRRGVGSRVKTQGLKTGLVELSNGLSEVEKAAGVMKGQLGEWKGLEVFDAITGKAEQQWFGPEEAATSFAKRTVEFYTQSVKRFAQTSADFKSDIDTIAGKFK